MNFGEGTLCLTIGFLLGAGILFTFCLKTITDPPTVTNHSTLSPTDPYPHLPNLFNVNPSISYWCTVLNYLPKPTWVEKVKTHNGHFSYDMWVYTTDKIDFISMAVRAGRMWDPAHLNDLINRLAEVKTTYKKTRKRFITKFFRFRYTDWFIFFCGCIFRLSYCEF